MWIVIAIVFLLFIPLVKLDNGLNNLGYEHRKKQYDKFMAEHGKGILYPNVEKAPYIKDTEALKIIQEFMAGSGSDYFDNLIYKRGALMYQTLYELIYFAKQGKYVKHNDPSAHGGFVMKIGKKEAMDHFAYRIFKELESHGITERPMIRLEDRAKKFVRYYDFYEYLEKRGFGADDKPGLLPAYGYGVTFFVTKVDPVFQKPVWNRPF